MFVFNNYDIDAKLLIGNHGGGSNCYSRKGMNWIEIASKSPILQGVSNPKAPVAVWNLQFQLRSFQNDEVIALQGRPGKPSDDSPGRIGQGRMTNASRSGFQDRIHWRKQTARCALLFAPDNRFPGKRIC
jgi:hypothetical protein